MLKACFTERTGLLVSISIGLLFLYYFTYSHIQKNHSIIGKWFPYQESIRVPLIIRDPRMSAEQAGTVEDSLTLNIDLANTVLSASEISPHKNMQGRDITELYLQSKKRMLKDDPWREEFLYAFPSLDEDHMPSSTALVRRKWKYIRWPRQENKPHLLFNLDDDPLELNDLVKNTTFHGQVLDEMIKRHDEMVQELEIPTEEIDCEKEY